MDGREPLTTEEIELELQRILPIPEDLISQLTTDVPFPTPTAKKALWLNMLDIGRATDWLLETPEEDADLPLSWSEYQQILGSVQNAVVKSDEIPMSCSFGALSASSESMTSNHEEIHRLLERAVAVVRHPGHMVEDRTKLLVADLVEALGGFESLRVSHNKLDPVPLATKKIIHARACIVCGRDDRPGQQRKSGFKCNECVGVPSRGRFQVEVVEQHFADKRRDDEGLKTINDYTLLSNLGKGSYGKVKLCVHNKSGQPYAVKILDKAALARVHRGGAKSAMDSVLHEIRVLKALQHPNVAKMYELIDDPSSSKMYLILEYLEHGQIYHIGPDGSSSQGPIEKERLKKYIVATCHGLQYLHENNIIHRDVKPENILLDANDNVKLTDFGVSASCGDSHDIMTETEGSPAFMAPENFSEAPSRGKAADVWAFGVTLYAMAFGRLPFIAKSLPELRQLVLTAEPDCTHPEAGLADILRTMLTKDPEKRITVDEILNHPYLEDVLTVKGMAVETIRLRIGVAPSLEAAIVSPPVDVQAVMVQCPSCDGDNRRGINEFINFLHTKGPGLQIVIPNSYTCSLYAPRKRVQVASPLSPVSTR